MGIKAKIIALVGIMIIFTISITTLIISNNVQTLSKKLNLQIADETAHRHALDIKSVFEKAMDAAKLLEIDFWQAHLAKLERRTLDKILIETIHNNDNIFGTWMLWEPNAYDKQDALFINTEGHDETGRVNSFWHWKDNKIINEPNHDWETSTWYNNPRSRAKETLEAPYFYQVSNVNTLLISAIQPIMHNNVFHGVIGVDINLDSLQKMIGSLKFLDTGYSTLIAHNGMYAAHPNKALIGTFINKEYIKAIQSGLPSQKIVYDHVINEQSYQISVPIFIGETETPWAFIVSIPMSKIVSSGDDISQLILLISLISGFIMLVTLFILVEKFVAPISKITEQLSVAVKAEDKIIPFVQQFSNDEVGQLANTFNLMAHDVNKSRDKLITANNHVLTLNIELEDKVISRTAELESSLAQQRAIRDQLVESDKMASLGRLVAGVAHELNTPIGICVTANSVLTDDISNLKKLISDGKLTKSHIDTYCTSTIETTNLIDFNLHRASELIRNFKMVSVDVSSNSIYSFNLIEYIEKVVQSLTPVISKTMHHINIVEREEIKITCDPGDISQILTNIVMNAITHAFTNIEKGNVIIDIRKQENSVYMVCKDNGVGMSSATRDKVFEPFFTTNRDNGGSGLGMHIVYNIVAQKLKGTIKCDSDHSGTCYTIIFPIGQ